MPLKPPFGIFPLLRRFLVCSSVAVCLGTACSAETTVEIVHYFTVPGQIQGLQDIQKDFEAANPDIKIKFTYIPFAELLSRTLQMAAVHKPPGISCIDNPDVRHVAKSGVLQDISASVEKFPTWQDTYPGPKHSVSEGTKVFGVPIGSNSLALFYNKKMLSDAGVTDPPKTWDELKEDSGKLTKSPVYGLAISAPNDEQATWQWEPFLWTSGGSLLDLTADPAKQALQLWVDLVKNGSVSKDCMNWSQPEEGDQFIGGQAAMMVMGPWMLGQVHKSGIDFGVSPIPVPKQGMKPVVPLGGECWCVLKGDPKVEAAAVKFIEFVQDPARLETLCNTFNYISSVRSVAVKQGQANPELQPFVLQMDTARARPEEGGANYTQVSLAARTAIQQALTGQATVDAALTDAAAKIKPLAAKK
jgi:multiple sugar transport system substrate-binding protein